MPYDSDEAARPLEYPLYNSADHSEADMEVVGDAAFLTWATTDPDEQVAITLHLSLNEYVALASAIDVGRDIAYGADSWQIWWIWIRAFSMAICEQVQECVEENDGVRNAIGSLIQQFGGDTEGRPLPQELLDQPANNPTETCDLDALYGTCVNIVQSTNRQIEDLLETIEAITNNQEALSTMVEFIPVIGDLIPVPEIVAIAQKIREWLAEAYIAGYDLTTEQEFICDLFCLAKDECFLSVEQARDYFWSKATSIPEFEDAFDTVETLLTALANWQQSTGEAVVWVMFGSAFGFLSFLNSLFGMTFAQFVLNSRAGLPNDDWIFLCPDCSVTEACFDTTSNVATLLDGEWHYSYPDVPDAMSDTLGGTVDLRYIFPQNMTLVSWEMQRQSMGELGSTILNQAVTLWLGGTQVATLYTLNLNSGSFVWQTITNTNGVGVAFDEVRCISFHVDQTLQIRLEICAETT